jgi:catechol 2,3-dioxygenase-like lactoylglutathione lyase family enzyme
MKQRVLFMIEGISAVTLGTHEMPRAVRFYCALGFEVLRGNEQSSFTSFRAGMSYLNLIAQPTERRWSWWGRVIFYVADVDALYERALAAGCQPTTAPRDAEWGERFFHLIDPTATNLVSHALCGPRCDSHEIGYSLSQLHPMRMRLPLERRRSAAYWRLPALATFVRAR